MSVYFKFKSAKDYSSLPLDSQFISVACLKEVIIKNKHLERGTDYDLLITNSQTNQDYTDDAMLIPKNTSVLVRRVPAPPRMPIVTHPPNKIKLVETDQLGPPPLNVEYNEFDLDEFGNDDMYALPEAHPVQSTNPVQDVPSRDDEDSKIKALVEASALDWQQQFQVADASGSRGNFGGGRAIGERGGFGRGMFDRKTPPPGYVCHRCNVPGHLIQHCPTNGDPNYDIKRVRPPTGIPRTMLIATQDGSYALPNGTVACVKPDEAAFDKEIQGLPTVATRPVTDIPPELRCPLCKQVMKDALLTSKCCFKSFCDKCIRDHTISKLMCFCGATNILADHLLPNMTLRNTINRLMESNNSSEEDAGSVLQVQDMESGIHAERKVPSHIFNSDQKLLTSSDCETSHVKDTADESKNDSKAPEQPQQPLEKASQGNCALADEKLQQNTCVSETGKKKKRQKICVPISGDPQWQMPQDIGALNYMMPFPPSAFNPYWGDMQQLGMGAFMNPYAGMMPFMGYAPHPFDFPIGSSLPQGPFGGQGNVMPVLPPKNNPEVIMPSNPAHTVKNQESEAQKNDLRRKTEMNGSENREFSREGSSTGDVSLMKEKHRLMPKPASSEHRQHYQEKSHTSLNCVRQDGRQTNLDSSYHHHYGSHHRAERQTGLKSSPHDHFHHQNYHGHHRAERETSVESSPHDHFRHQNYHGHHRAERETSVESSPHDHYRSHHRSERETRLERSQHDHSCHHYYQSHHRAERETYLDHSSHEVKEHVQLGKRRKDHDPPLHEVQHMHFAKRKSAKDDAVRVREAAEDSEAEKKHKAGVFSRISVPTPSDGGSKKRKLLTERRFGSSSLSSSHPYHHKETTSSSNEHREEIKEVTAAVVITRRSSHVSRDDYGLDDDERHFKRRSSWYDSGSSRKHRDTSTSTDRMPLLSVNRSLSQVYCA